MKKKLINRMSLTFPASSVNESFARSAVASFCAQVDPTVDELSDLRTAVSEAVTNAIVHGYRGNEKGIVYITAKNYDDRSITIKIEDKGCGIKEA